MAALDYDIHFSTATDPCNYVFKKFCPRLTMHIDDIGIRDALNLPDSIHYMEDNVFSGCTSLKHVTLPKQLRWIAPELFDSSGIESIEIHDGIEEIGYWAFWGCKNLKSLTIPESVTRIGRGIVSAHEGFEGVVCHAPGFHVENDALIEDGSGTLLCCWTTQKDYVVPECVKRIADFSLNNFVETITVRQYVEIMDSETFASNTNLKKTDFLGGYGAETRCGKSSSNWVSLMLSDKT